LLEHITEALEAHPSNRPRNLALRS